MLRSLLSPGLPAGPAARIAALLLFAASGASVAGGASAAADAPPATSPDDPAAEAKALLATATAPWTGDLDGILARGLLRIGSAYSPQLLAYDGPDQTGMVVEAAAELEKALKEQHGKAAATLTVMVVPLPRDALIPGLVDGRVDIAAANLTITPARAERVAFADPMLTDVSEVVVTGPAAPAVSGFDDLVAIGLYLRPSSSYAESLARLNAEREGQGRPAIPFHAADERLGDGDLLELVDAGTLPATTVDSHAAALWRQAYESLAVHEDLTLREGGAIAWAVRADAPDLLAAVNAFVKTARRGTLLGNILFERYYDDPDRIADALDAGSTERFDATIDLIRKQAEAYGFPPLLIAAQGYQESRLDQGKRGPTGAVGIMQVLPATARDPNVAIPDIQAADRNVEAGVKYLRFLRDRYFDDPAIAPEDKAFLGLAAYNAGPGNIAKARERAEKMGLDPNVWFDNVEVATARAVGREPVTYVRNILKYFTSYRLYREAEAAKP